MAERNVKVDEEIHAAVVTHTQKAGMKVGKFFDLAAREKLERERKSEKVRYDKFDKKV